MSLSLLVNLIEFNHNSPWDSDSSLLNPSIDLPELLELNAYFFRKMQDGKGGEIRNVVSRPADSPDFVLDMFYHTQAMLMEVAEEINQSDPDRRVYIHTLGYSPQSLVLQSDRLPAQVAHDLVPNTCSAREIATYGYQVVALSNHVSSDL